MNHILRFLFFLYTGIVLAGESYEKKGGIDRSFPKSVKDECWEKFPEVDGRDPNRWRHDAVGNIVSYSLRGCDGCLCHEYDHIVPFSKGGESVLDNCQILQQRANRFKGNEDDDKERTKSYSCKRKFSKRELDVIEMAIYGDVHDEDGDVKCRCKSGIELESVDPSSFSISSTENVASESENDDGINHYEADVEESARDTSTNKKKRKRKNKNKKKKSKAQRNRAESVDSSNNEQARPPADSYKYKNCK